MYRTVRSTLRTAPAPALLLLVALSAGCGPPADEAAGDEPAGASEAFVDGPELWLAQLEYDGEGVPRLGTGRNVTRRAGYDNQPKFLPDGSILYTRGVGERTDIWRYDPATDTHSAVTETPNQSEYSATPTPDGTGFSAIVVEPDSMQRLWRFDLDGTNGAPIFEDIAPVGYHAWANDSTVLMYVLGDTATLQRAVSRGPSTPGPGEILDLFVERSLNRVPGREAVSYMSRYGFDGGDFSIVGATGEPENVWGGGLMGGPDHAWTPGGELLFGSTYTLVSVRPAAEGPRWNSGITPVGALPDTTLVISRLAVSDDGMSIVLVVDRPQN
jgi:hypothetical protein